MSIHLEKLEKLLSKIGLYFYGMEESKTNTSDQLTATESRRRERHPHPVQITGSAHPATFQSEGESPKAREGSLAQTEQSL